MMMWCLLDKDWMNQGFKGLLVDLGRLGFVQVFRFDQTRVPVSNVPVAWSCQHLLFVQWQPLARAPELLSGVLASMVLNGQHRVGNDFFRINFGW